MLKSSQQFDVNRFISESNQIKKIPINMLVPYHNHQFQLYSGERLEDMIESIKQNGILNPILVQPIENGSMYEILSGHNRVEGAKLIGLDSVPAIIKENLSEDEAEMYVIETNLIQRGFNDLLISEQATVLKSRHSKMFSQGKRNDIIKELERLENKITSSPLEKKLNKSKNLTSMDKVGLEYGMSRPTVARLLRINYLIQPLKNMIDDNSLSLRVGVEFSYIPEDKQSMIYNIISTSGKKISMKLSKDIRNLFNSNEVPTKEQLENLIVGNKSSIDDTPIKVLLNRKVYSKYFDGKVSTNEINDTIEKALDLYFNQKKYI